MPDTPVQPAAPSSPAPVATPRPWWWRLIGIRRRVGKRLPVGLTLWGWALLLAIIAVVGGGGFAEYTMQPDFCRSCHIMEPYYQAWHTSTHKDVPCADCHFEPGFRKTLWGKFQASKQAVAYFTQTYGSKPHAEIRDASCLRSDGCHERRLLEGKVNWELTNSRGHKMTIRFDHTPHIQELRRGKQLRCVSCHSQIVQGQHIVVTLESCFICHFKGLRHGRDEEVLGGCGACHDAPKEQIRLATGMFNHADYLQRGVTCENCHADAIKGDGAVPRQLCWSCHNQPLHLARYGESDFIHRTHVTEHKVECSNCHLQIEHHLSVGVSLAAGPSPGSGERSHESLGENTACGQCHEGSHAGPAALYRGVGGRGVPEMPSPMWRAQVDCSACHQVRTRSSEEAEVLGQTFSAVQQSCDYCHGHQYDGVLDEWKVTIAEHLDRAETAYGLAETSLTGASLSAEDRLKRLRLLDDAGHNIRIVKLGHGVHNVNYATALLNVALERCNQVLRDPQHERPAEEPDL